MNYPKTSRRGYGRSIRSDTMHGRMNHICRDAPLFCQDARGSQKLGVTSGAGRKGPRGSHIQSRTADNKAEVLTNTKFTDV